MKSIVITGSTRGIGYGLADEFLKRGCRVAVNGRSAESVDEAMNKLAATHGRERLTGLAGDASQAGDVQALWDAAAAAFGQVDIWINNAGVGHPYKMVWELPVETVNRVVDIDLKGLIFGSQVAIRGMLAQGSGHLYNMEGFGSDGRMRPGISVYGSTKAAVRFLSRSLMREVKGTPVKVSTLSPGIVITDFLSEQYRDDPQGFEDAKRVFNTLGDKVETVTPWLVEQVLKNDRSGANINWLTTPKLLSRFAMMPFSKRDLYS
jgi:NAD(P)-dependent dehydrogenase (short-subunit alcohol dehydrogenase family)